MNLYQTLNLKKEELEEIYASLGGKYSLLERIKRKGIGSPMMYYEQGHVLLDKLQAKASNELLINIELLKSGFLLRISERTTPYFIPYKNTDIYKVKLFKTQHRTNVIFETIDGISIQLWGGVDRFMAWESFLNNSFLKEKLM